MVQVLSNEVSAHYQRQCQNYWVTTEAIYISIKALATHNQPVKYQSPTARSLSTGANFRKWHNVPQSPQQNELDATDNALMFSLAGFLYGCVSVGLAFVASRLGGILQATMSIVSAFGGPLLGVFTLGIFVPFSNGKASKLRCYGIPQPFDKFFSEMYTPISHFSFKFDSWAIMGLISNVTTPPRFNLRSEI